MCSLFAATYPEKTSALVMIGTYAKRIWAPDYPWAPTLETRGLFFDEIREHWGGPVGLEVRAPSVAADPAFRAWWSTYLRMGASPGAALRLTQMNSEIDVCPVLPSDPRADAHPPPHRRSLPPGRRRTLCRRTDSGRAFRRAPRRGSSAVCRRSGRDARRNRGVPDRLEPQPRARSRARHGDVRPRLGGRRRDEWRGRAPTRSTASTRTRARSSSGSEADGLPPTGRVSSAPSTDRPVPSGARARSAPRPRASASTSESACTPANATSGTTRSPASRSTWRPRSPPVPPPGEVLVSRTVKDLVAGSGLRFEDHGKHALDGVRRRLAAVRRRTRPAGAVLTIASADQVRRRCQNRVVAAARRQQAPDPVEPPSRQTRSRR